MTDQAGFQHSARTNASRLSRPAGTFPAGTAVFALSVSFVLLRIAASLTRQSLASARIAIIAGVVGALLGTVAVFSEIVAGARGRGPLGWALAGVRIVLATPLALLISFSVFGDPPEPMKWWALYGTGATVALALGHGIVRARGLWLARATLALLLFGELIELAWPPAHVALAPGSFWPRLTDKLGAFSELSALIGAPLALAWAISATRRVAGAQRVAALAPFPILGSAMLSMLALQIRGRDAVSAARVWFGVRFDLLAREGQPLHITGTELLFYLLVPQMLICAAVISVGGVGVDGGASGRRALGWTAVLLAGFGALTLAGPMDPIRLVTVALAAVLLERAALLEAEERAAPPGPVP